ncbi:hypothetical protein L1049_025529 [Liquidambar formosana]|uniref:Vacuolar amino acid transporter YPQ1 n=1 Tax=Liquidambar formosana TaxID=63359 RepID=A0AAP0R8H7_LIQFO
MKPTTFSYCSKEKQPCVRWVEKYFKDCLCSLSDEISFSFGFISLICWGIAEIPQIITNFKTKSGHGVSLAFLLTWVVGDFFNLVGCLLEPATLPTQYYTALLYTITTVVLVLQCMYYDHIGLGWKCQEIEVNMAKDDSKRLKPKSLDLRKSTPCGPIEVPRQRDFYYRSARSLAGSDTPPSHSYLKFARSGPSALNSTGDSSSEDDKVLGSYKKSAAQSLRIPRSVGYGTFLAAVVDLPLQSKALTEAYLKLSGRRLLQEHGLIRDDVCGQWLGWLMAAIYIGGRLPQIWLNIKRGSVEGLNPLMFIFALTANVTYVGSILVRSTKWEKIKANMPWLLDAILCVALDFFIIFQYIYYKFIKQKRIK